MPKFYVATRARCVIVDAADEAEARRLAVGRLSSPLKNGHHGDRVPAGGAEPRRSHDPPLADEVWEIETEFGG